MNYDLIIVGSGPAGIFTALELIKRGTKKKMLLIEKGKPVEKRHCPKAEVGHCVNCKPSCAITTGFSGAGAFSDGKLSLSYEVGGDLPMLIGEDFAQELINYTDKIYLEFGADTKIEGINTGDAIKEIRKNAIKAGLKLVDCPIRHLGTEKAQELYLKIQNFLADNGVDMMFSTECKNIIIEDSVCKGVIIDDKGKDVIINAPEIVIATGRRGADWLDKLCIEHNIAHKPGTVDIGVRVECRNEVMEKVNELHPPKEEPKEEKPEEKVVDIEAKPEITFDDFAKLQFQVGEVIACEAVKKSKKLLCSQVKIGSQVRQIVSGIKAYYTPEEMVGKKVMVVTNLKPAKLAGILSEGMILCAEDADGNVCVVSPEKNMPAGSEIC